MSYQLSSSIEPDKMFQNLIAYYIQRQQLVVLAMLDLHPTALKMGGDTILGIDLDPYLEMYGAKQEFMKDTTLLSKGIWKQTWKYRIHGIGCQLTHWYTGEPIEWDAPDPNAFRFEWFYYHLEWRIEHEADDIYVGLYHNWRDMQSSDFDLENYLLNTPIVTQRNDGPCRLTTEN